MNADAAARELLLSPEEGVASFGAQRRLFSAVRCEEPRETVRRARAAVRSALDSGALIHVSRRWCLGIDCWSIICELKTPVELR